MKTIGNLFKNIFVLVIITAFAGGILGLVFEATKDPIEALAIEKTNNACREVFSDAKSFEVLENFSTEKAAKVLEADGQENADIENVFRALDANGELLGYTITIVTHEGYSGDIEFMIGVALDGTIHNMSLLSINETPGLGMNAEEEYLPQITELKADQIAYTKTGKIANNEVNAISGATITTNALTNGINAGLSYFRSINIGGEANE